MESFQMSSLVCHVSLNIMCVRVIYIVGYSCNLFITITIPLCEYNFLFHSSFDGHINCFQCEAYIKKFYEYAVYVLVNICLLGIRIGMELLDHRIYIYWSLTDTAEQFPNVNIPVYNVSSRGEFRLFHNFINT